MFGPLIIVEVPSLSMTGAWPFLVGGVICLVNSDNERDSVLLNSVSFSFELTILLRGTGGS